MSGGGKGGKGGGGPRARQKTERVKTARGRKTSSTRWLQRQLNDPWVAEAKRLGYRSRAAFKLLQLDDRFDLLKPGRNIVDLGCAPGGWLQVAIERTDPQTKGGKVVGIDYLDSDPLAGAEILCLDFLDDAAPAALKAALGGTADIVMSDMAAPTTGHAATDHLRIIALAETAYAFAQEVLTPGGAFLCKVFQGGTERSLLDPLKRDFELVRHAKPDASRTDSKETYVLATGFRGRPGEDGGEN